MFKLGAPLLKPTRRWRSSERIALHVLEEMGYRVLEVHKRIVIDGVEVGEVDVLAEGPDGNLYAVEVKAGRADVTSIRQAYVNALLIGAKPLVVARGFADEAAEKVAEKLGVKVINLSDQFLVDVDELEEVIYEALSRLLTDMVSTLASINNLEPGDLKLLMDLVSSSSLEEFASRVGLDVREAAKLLAEAKRKGIIPKFVKSFETARSYARFALSLLKLWSCVDRLSAIVDRLERSLEKAGLL